MLSCFHVLAVKNYAAVIIPVHIFVCLFVGTPIFYSLGYMLKSGISGSYGNSVFNFWRINQIIFHSVCIILHSHSQCKGSNFSTSLPTLAFSDFLSVSCLFLL